MILIDALDECNVHMNPSILDVIERYFSDSRLPGWLGFLMTSRPKEDIDQGLNRVGIDRALSPFHVKYIEQSSEENKKDMLLYVRHELQGKMKSKAEVDKAANIMLEKSEGQFIYASYALTTLKMQTGELSLDDISSLPTGLDVYYEKQFDRIGGIESSNGKSLVRRLAETIVISEEPIFIDTAVDLLSSSKDAIRQAQKELSLFFPLYDDHLHIYHKSVTVQYSLIHIYYILIEPIFNSFIIK